MSGEMIAILAVAARLTEVAVELNTGNRIFTTLPVVSCPEMTSRGIEGGSAVKR